MAAHGADLHVRNSKGQTPLDLCPDPKLAKTLEKCAKEYKSQSQPSSPTHKNSEDVDECIICSTNKRNVIFSPCQHIATCEGCAGRVKKCLLCRNLVDSWNKIEECVVCSDRRASVLFKPCNHLSACHDCASLMKKCVKCRSVIEKMISASELHRVEQEEKSFTNKKGCSSDVDVDILARQLQDMKEQIVCVVCLDRRKNMVFLCGHGACQLCGDKLQNCPMCREPIEKRILLF